MIPTTARRVRQLLPLFVLLLATVMAGLVTVSSNPALADTMLCSGNSYSTCTDAGYTDHAYSANSATSYWSMTSGHDCTNYVAYVESQNGAPTPSYNLGNADMWASNASSHGVTVNTTPVVGSVAQWGDSTNHSTGHVAYVEAVNSDGSITVSEDTFSSGPFAWENLAPGDANYPNYFIHFKDLNDLLLARVGNTLYGKQGLGDGWTTLATDATDVKAAGTRIAYVDTSGNLKVKDGLAGSWVTETSGVSQYVVTPNYLIVRFSDGTVYGKAGLSDGWTALDTTDPAVDIQASGTRIAFKDSSGNLKVKDTLAGSWVTETSGFSQYVITPSYLIVRFTDGTVYGKASLTAGWTALDTTDTAVDIQASGTRIAYQNSSGTLYVKDTLAGSWVNEASSASQYAVTADNYLVIRQSSTLSGKGGLGDGWTTMTTSASDFKATYARFAFLDSSNELWAKDSLNGSWYDEQSSVSQYVIS